MKRSCHLGEIRLALQPIELREVRGAPNQIDVIVGAALVGVYCACSGAFVQNSSLVPPTFHFGLFELNPQSGELRKNGMKIRLQGQPVEILLLLLHRPGEVITREELQKKLWPADTFVDFEQGLNNTIKRLRAALDDDSENPRFIETLPRRGYRFIGTVTQTEPTQVTARIAEDKKTPAEHESRYPVEGKEEKVSTRRSRSGFWMATAIGLAVLCLGAVLGIRGAAYLTRLPRVIGFEQLTNDYQVKDAVCGIHPDLLLSDGPRVFFPEPGAVAQVSSHGGDIVKVPHPSKCFIFSDLSPDKTELIGGTLEKSSDLDNPLWTLSLATGQARRLGNLIGHAATWFPDGQKIAFAVGSDLTGDQGNDVYLADRNGNDVRKLARIEHGFIPFMRWSPDGKVLRSNVWISGSCYLWDVSEDTTGKQLKTLFPGGNPRACWINWTPDGRYSLVVVRRERGVGWDTWVFPEKHSFLRWRSSRPTRLTSGPVSFFYAAPSPDGKRIYAIGVQLRGELLRYDLRSQRLEPFLGGISADQLDFSRDGRWVTYVSFPDHTLWRSRVDGSERLQLTTPPFVAATPNWSPDGTKIVFSELLPNGHWKTYVIPADGGKPEMTPQSQEEELNATWTPDGRSLIIGGYGHTATTRVTSVDLRTNRVSVIPGSEGLRAPHISYDGRYIVAIESKTDGKFFLFDQQTQKWSLLVSSSTMGLGWPTWSGDSKSVYFCNWAEGPPVRYLYRVRIADLNVERIAGINVPEGLTGYFGGFVIPTPDGSPLVLRDTGSQEIYAMDVDLP